MKTQQPVRASRHILAFSLAIAAACAAMGAQATELKRAEPMIVSAKRPATAEAPLRRAEPIAIVASRAEVQSARVELRRAEPMTVVAQRPADGASLAQQGRASAARRAG